ncbi:hypothetical protein, partial [Clavibacter michiganensis]|uniref:hypothetical protein n=1 Tax=Clavibacter michiganensis TaxID=28447 RepID=UPI002931B38D
MMAFPGRWSSGRPVYEGLDARDPGPGHAQHDGRRPEATAVGARSPSSAGSPLRGVAAVAVLLYHVQRQLARPPTDVPV